MKPASVYLHDIPLSEARSRFQRALENANRWKVLGVETLPLDENAVGRVLAEPIWAKISSPHYHAAAMDGFAVRAETTAGAQPSVPLSFAVGTGNAALGAGRAQYLDTGDPLPEWANAVVPIENVESLDQDGAITQDIRRPAYVRLRAAVAPWTNVRPLGEDIVATQLVLAAGQLVRPVDLGAIAAAGHDRLHVARKPRVAIIPTGSELVPIGSTLERGDILEYNSVVLAAQIWTMGGEPTRFPICRDEFGAIRDAVSEAAQKFDLILLNAGSSAGAEDFSARVIEDLGELLVHGVAVRPGHPVIMGMIRLAQAHGRPRTFGEQAEITDARATASPSQVPIIGVPGFPVSAALTMEIFVEPILAKWLGRHPAELTVERARLTRKITSPPGDEDYVRVAVARVGDHLVAAPLARGAGVITSLVKADGIVTLRAGVQGADAGEEVAVRLCRTKAELERTIMCIGSHDLILDLLAQFLVEYDRRMVSVNAGSQGGLVALRRGEAHISGSHLLDPRTGEYNVSYVRQYLPGIPVKMVALAGREQGLLVRRGNPKGIETLNDLSRPGVLFVNRQRGAGTRVLLDHHLGILGISPSHIQGYNQEEYTHLGVAVAVASGRADTGLAIAGAAQALDLDFVPLFRERYDLVMPREHADSELLSPIFALMKRQDFRDAVAELKGYDVSVMGTVILEDP